MLIAGLGNPGPKYAETRHNVGYGLVRLFSARHGFPDPKRECQALLSRKRVEGRTIFLVQPLTFMNNSGRAVERICRRYEFEPGEVLVVHDDLDLPPGRLRFRPGGGAGGHRGVRSIIATLGTECFPRLRIGIGRPPCGMEARAYVLSRFSPEERDLIHRVLDRAVVGIEAFIRGGIEEAMNTCNGLDLAEGET